MAYQPTTDLGRQLAALFDDWLPAVPAMLRSTAKKMLEPVVRQADTDPAGLQRDARPHAIALARLCQLTPADLEGGE